MAPALVKQCTAKERDSISRKIFDLSYIPPISIACFDQVGRPCLNGDKLFVRQLYTADQLTNKFDPFMNERDSKMPLPDLFQKQATTNDIDIMNKKAGSFEHIQENVSALNPKSCNLIANKDKSSANCQQINHKQSNPSTTSSEALISLLNEKQCQIQLKLAGCNNDIIGLQERLRNFQFRSLQSHSGETFGTTKLNSSEYQSSHDSANCKQQIGSKESILSKAVETIKPKLKKIYDTIHYTWDEETDNEELDEDYKCRIPIGRGKKRSEKLVFIVLLLFDFTSSNFCMIADMIGT